MLNRRILRTKAFKAVYAYAENPGMSMGELEALLEFSCESTRDLYLFLLSSISPLTCEAFNRIEAAKTKFNPNEEERNPNLKFAENLIAKYFEEDPDFQKISSKKKFDWGQYDVLVRKLYDSIRGRKYFKEYMKSEERSLAQDAGLFRKIFEREFEDSTELAEILEDLSIYWNDDLGYALVWCCKTMGELANGEHWRLPLLYQSDMIAADIKAGKREAGPRKLESDHAFVLTIVRKAHAKFDDYCAQVAALTPKWTRERLCATDLALIACGMAEAECFPALPAKVIINEYVELSKFYSTPDSRAFVNGLLDKLINKE